MKLNLTIIIIIIISLLYFIKFDNAKLITYLFIYSSLLIINPLFKYTSLIGNEPFYNPNILYESRVLIDNWKIFRDEVLATYKTYTSIKGDMFFSNNIIKSSQEWKKLYIKWHSDIDKIALEKL